jgi:hypothetical protein
MEAALVAMGVKASVARAIIKAKPSNETELLEVKGVGPKTIDQLGQHILTALSSSSVAADESGNGGSGGGLKSLSNALLKDTGIFRNVADFTSVRQTFRLVATCKELHSVQEVFQNHKLPTVCDMSSGDELRLFRAMVGAPASRWLDWLDTSRVKELKLPKSVTDEELLRVFDNKRFSELQSIEFMGGERITDAVLSEVGRRSPNIQSLTLNNCPNIKQLCHGFPLQLQSLKINCCGKIIDSSLLDMSFPGVPGSYLQSLDICNCNRITDMNLFVFVKTHKHLQSLNISKCSRITPECYNSMRLMIADNVARRMKR